MILLAIGVSIRRLLRYILVLFIFRVLRAISAIIMILLLYHPRFFGFSARFFRYLKHSGKPIKEKDSGSFSLLSADFFIQIFLHFEESETGLFSLERNMRYPSSTPASFYPDRWQKARLAETKDIFQSSIIQSALL